MLNINERTNVLIRLTIQPTVRNECNFWLWTFLYLVPSVCTVHTVSFLIRGNRRGRDRWVDLGVDGWIILGWNSKRWDVAILTGLGWSRIETGGGRLWLR